MNKINKKKKGFTLIELVIVLAVLAIIALIAIPNFTKVRNDSLVKADARTMEQIEKITLMAIADKDIEVPASTSIVFNVKKDSVAGVGAATATADYGIMLKEVGDPQVNGVDHFVVTVASNSDVTVQTGTNP